MCFGLVSGDLFSSSDDELSEVRSCTTGFLTEFFAPLLGEFLAPLFGELRAPVLGELLADPLVLPLSLDILRFSLELLREALRPFFCRVLVRTLSYTLVSPSESEVANTKILRSFF